MKITGSQAKMHNVLAREVRTNNWEWYYTITETGLGKFEYRNSFLSSVLICPRKLSKSVGEEWNVKYFLLVVRNQETTVWGKKKRLYHKSNQAGLYYWPSLQCNCGFNKAFQFLICSEVWTILKLQFGRTVIPLPISKCTFIYSIFVVFDKILNIQ